MTSAADISPAGPPTERPLFAIALRLLSMAMLTTMLALVKLLGERGVNLIEMVFYRQLFSLPIVYAWVVIVAGPLGFRTRHISRHVSRTAIGLIGMGFNLAAPMLLPLAESTTVSFTAPIFATILSTLFLREAAGRHRWTAVAIGFLGVLVMVRPDGAHFPPLGLAVALAGALGVAVVSIILRRLGRTEAPQVIVFWFSALSLPPMALLMVGYGQMHDPVTFALVFAMGTVGGIAQLLLTSALRYGRVSVVLPMDYSSILWSTMFGFLLWNAVPLVSTWIGATLIIGSGLYIILREQRLGRAAKLRAQAETDPRG